MNKQQLLELVVRPTLAEIPNGPSGFAKGYDIEFVNIYDSFVEIEDLVFDFSKDIELSNFMEMDDLSSVLKWTESLPNLNNLRKEQE